MRPASTRGAHRARAAPPSTRSPKAERHRRASGQSREVHRGHEALAPTGRSRQGCRAGRTASSDDLGAERQRRGIATCAGRPGDARRCRPDDRRGRRTTAGGAATARQWRTGPAGPASTAVVPGPDGVGSPGSWRPGTDRAGRRGRNRQPGSMDRKPPSSRAAPRSGRSQRASRPHGLVAVRDVEPRVEPASCRTSSRADDVRS